MAQIDHLERALRGARTAVLDELADPPGQRRYDPELADAGTELRGALSDVVHTVRTSDARLDFRDLVAEALDAGQVALLEADGDADALRRLDLEEEVADLLVLDARLQVAARLRDVPTAQEVVEKTGLKKAYVSELRNMSKRMGGLPSADAALRIDQALGLDEDRSLAALIRRTKAERVRLREQRSSWVAATAAVRAVVDPAVDRRVQALAEAARRDDMIARAGELLIVVGDRERRAVVRLLEELTGS